MRSRTIYEVLTKNGTLIDYMTADELGEKYGVSRQRVYVASQQGKSVAGMMIYPVDKEITRNSKEYKEWDRFYKSLRGTQDGCKTA